MCEQVAHQKLLNNEGDCLIAATMVNYLAPLAQKFRTRLYQKWIKDIKDLGINVSHEVNFNSLFSDPLKVKKWLDNGLPSDSSSIQNAIILDKT